MQTCACLMRCVRSVNGMRDTLSQERTKRRDFGCLVRVHGMEVCNGRIISNSCIDHDSA